MNCNIKQHNIVELHSDYVCYLSCFTSNFIICKNFRTCDTVAKCSCINAQQNSNQITSLASPQLITKTHPSDSAGCSLK